MKSRMVTTLLAVFVLISMKANSMSQSTTNTKVERCNSTAAHSNQLWGDVDPNIFYLCDEVNNTTRQLRCPPGRGFFNGHGHQGCIPYGEWPACIDSNSGKVSGGHATQLCRDEEHLKQTWAAMDPNKFYMCQEKNATALLLNCEPGKGYVNVWVAGGGHHGHEGGTHILGCAAWSKWRRYMQCESFY